MSTDIKLLTAQARIKVLTRALSDLHYLVYRDDQVSDAAGDALRETNDTAELDALIADAERYRWLRSQDTGPWQILDLVNDECNPPYLTLKFGFALDAAIDAMKEVKK